MDPGYPHSHVSALIGVGLAGLALALSIFALAFAIMHQCPQ